MANIQTLSYNKLLKQAQKKKSERETANKFLDAEIKLDSIVTIDSNKEIALAQYYSSIPGVELDSNINIFWNEQDSRINGLDMQTPKNEYLSAFRELQDILEASDEKDRQYTGSSSLKVQEKEAKTNLKEAKKSFAEQYKKYQETISTSDPFKMLSELAFSSLALLSSSEEQDKIKNAKNSLESAKKGVKSAEKSLESIKERKKTLKESKDKLNVKEYMAREKMSDALQKIYDNKVKAKKINDQSEKIQTTLQKQYDIIDKLTAIQKLNKSPNYPAIRTLLTSQNPGLLAELDNIPDSLPNNTFKVSLTNPLTLSAIQPDTDKISEIEQKIIEAEGKLPHGININDLSEFELKNTDTIQDLENQMSTITNHTSKEYKTLEMKRNHLVLQEKIETITSEIETLRNEVVNNGASQDKLKELKSKQEYLKILEEDFKNDPYSKTLSNLKELQSLKDEKKHLEAIPRKLANIDSINHQLETSTDTVPTTTDTISDIFKNIQEKIKNSKENLPMPTRHQSTRSGPTGPTR